MTRPSKVRRFLVAAVLTTGACFGYRRVDTAPHPGTRVRIVLTTATEVAMRADDDPRAPQAAVLEANGTVLAVAADTIVLRLGELRTAAGAVPGVEGRVALLPTDRVARIERREFQAGRTALTGVGVATIAVAVFLVVIISTLTHAN